MLRDALEPLGMMEFEQAPLATAEQAELAHDPAYVRGFMKGTLTDREIRRIGFPYSEFLVRRTMASLGGTLAAANTAMVRGISGCLAGGTHHAARAEGSGFCVFNDIAVGIKALGRRAAVIDLDVHQGDGTAGIFAGDESVFTFSIHGANNFPFRKQHSSLDIALPDGTGDDEYLEALETALPRVFAFQPEVIFYQAGVDALASDKLGRLSMTPQGMARRDSIVFREVRQRRIPLVITLGGGYSEPIELTVAAQVNTFRLAGSIE